MRLRAIPRRLRGQDVCLFCTFRQSVEAQTPRRQFLYQSRSYQSTSPSQKPATGAAVAEKEEDDEDAFPSGEHQEPVPERKLRPGPRVERRSPPLPAFRQPSRYESMPDWSCRCGHINLPNRDSCTMCRTPKPDNPQLHYPRQVADRPLFADGRQNPRSAQSHFEGIGESRQSRFGGHQIERGNRSVDPGFQDRRASPPDGASRLGSFGRPSGPTRRIAETPPVDSRPPRGTLADALAGNPRWRASDTPTRAAPRSRFGLSSDDRPSSASSSNHRPPLQRDIGGGRSRFGAMIDKATYPGVPVIRRVGISFEEGPVGSRGVAQPVAPRSAPQRATNTRGMGVFGLDELEKVLGSNAPPGRGSKPSRVFDEYAGSGSVLSRGEDVLPPVSSSEAVFGDIGRRKPVREEKAERRNRRFALEDDDVAPDMVQEQNKRSQTQQRSSFAEADFDDALEDFDEPGRRRKKTKGARRAAPTKPQVQLPEFISVEKLAQALRVKLDTFLHKLEEEGFEGARYDHILDVESSAMFADLYGFEPIVGGPSAIEDLVARPPAEDKSLLPPRPPIVTIMGHVDHGKTTILDWLRKSSVVESEHGGITQHIGAFSFTMPGSDRPITFLDTPGHAAFLDMRRRGANVTDIVVLVVAADDSVKPQTIEAIKHALDAKVQIIVAINKIDKEDAKPERVKQDLSKHDIVVEDYGGEYQAISLSGKTGQGMDDLEEAILTLADVSDFRAEIDGPAEGYVIESKVTIAGRVATILVRRGTLRPGDIIVAGTTWSRVRTLRNDAGVLVDEAPPGTPVQVDGWRGDPTAGLEVLGATDEDHAKSVVELRLETEEKMRTSMDMAAINAARTQDAEERARTLEREAEQRRNFVSAPGKRRFIQALDNEGWVEGRASNGPQKVHFVVKADVAGSVEALVAAVSAVGNNEISANIIHSGAGLLTESDIRHLAATGETSYAISFNQPIENSVARLAEAAGLQILDHNIIYKVTDDVKAKLSDALPPLVTQKVLGEAEVGQVFDISTKKGKLKIAGCRISNGAIGRSHKVRVIRGGETIYTGTLESLKNVKKDVSEMRKGQECGMGFDNWSDFDIGDSIQCFETKEEKRTLY